MAVTEPIARRQLFSCRWIVSARFDLFFFIGSCVFTFLFYGLYHLFVRLGFAVDGTSVLGTYFVFTAFFDHPHIFQTLCRTHYDREEFHKRPGLYTWGLGAFVGAGFVVLVLGYTHQMIVFAALFGSWHVIRQHSGFLKAYKRRNRDIDPVDNWVDGLVFYTGMFACFFNDYSDVGGPTAIYGQTKVQFPDLSPETGEIVWDVFELMVVVFVGRQIWRILQGQPVNLPKLLLMGCTLFTHYVVFFTMATSFLVAEALETAYHTVQYQGWMIHYQRKRFPEVKRVVWKWAGISLAYGTVVGVVEVYSLLEYPWAVWLFIPFTMLVLFHYYVDGLIWQFRKYPELSRLLFGGNKEVSGSRFQVPG